MSFLRKLASLQLRCSHSPLISLNSAKNGGRLPSLNMKYNYCSTSLDEETEARLTYDQNFVYEDPKSEEEVVNVTFRDRNGKETGIRAKVGDNVLRLAHRHDIDLEGSCNGVAACSTCHCYVEGEYFDMLPEPEDDEADMLDLAAKLKPESRLGCQIYLVKELEGMTLALPSSDDDS